MVTTSFATLPDGLAMMALFDQAFAKCASGNIWANVTDFGGVGDGVTDNTAAYAAAVASLPNGGTVYTPPGKFYCVGGVNDGTNSAAIRFLGASNGSDHTNSPSAYVFSTGSCILVGTNNISAVTINNIDSSIENMNVEGCNSITTTAPAVLLNSIAQGSSIRYSRVKFGSNCISSAATCYLDHVRAFLAYGSAIVNVTSSSWIDDCSFDQTSSVLGQKFPPAFNTVVSSWTANTVVTAAGTASTIVSIGGFWVQCLVSGTTGAGSAPTVKPYGVSILDGTAQWVLLCPATYYGLMASSPTIRGCDISGPFQAGIYLTAAGNAHITDNNMEVWKHAIWAHDGSQVTISGNNLAQDVDAAGASVLFDTTWTGDSIVIGNTGRSVEGVQILGGANYQLDDNLITVNGVLQLVATNVAGIIYFVLKGVNFNSATSDNAMPLLGFPVGMTRFQVSNVFISNASHTLVTATCGVFTTTGGSGTIAADQAITVSSTSDAANNNSMALVLTNSPTTSYVLANLAHTPNIYFRIGTPEGAAATGDVTIEIRPLP